ncbi:MAG: BatD family protein [Bacteroidales bacterium]|nr:BatD family protein [Bacteroidales bacterium]
MIQKRISILVLSTLLITNAFSQNVSFKAEAPRLVRVGEQFQLTFSVNQSISNFQAPNLNDFQYLGGPQTGHSTSIQMGGGKTIKNTTYTYTYFLRGSKPGKFTISPASASYKSKTIKSNSLTIEVVGSANQSTQSGQTGSSTQKSNVKTGGEDIFIRLHVDKKTAYVGEQVTAWVKLYTKVNISGLEQPQGLDYTGFYKQDVEIPELRQLNREKVGNEIYHTGVIQKVILYPQQSGQVTIKPFTVTTQVQQQTNQSRSIFDDFFGSSYRTVNIELKSKAVKLNIKPMPGDNKPGDFSGAVGTFKIKGSVNNTSVKTNDAITFKVTISGTGNVKLLDNIETNFPAAFDVFDPVINTQLDAGTNGKSGRKTFEYTVIPRHAGEFTVQPFEFTYFNPSTKQYKTINTPEYTINVAKGDNDTAVTVISGISKKEIEILGSDIKFIETDFELQRQKAYFIASPLFYLSYIIPLLLLVAILIVRRQQIKERADRAKYLNRRANKQARKRLKVAREMLEQNKADKFYEEITKALWGYLSEKVGIPISELSVDSAKKHLLSRNINEDITSSFIQMIEDCEFARYAPSSSGMDMKEIVEKSATLISQIDQKIKL